MPKVQHVKARKDYPEVGVKKGDMYYTWNLITGPRSSRTYRQLTPPKRSQLTTSSFLQTVYDIEDDLGSLNNLDDIDDIVERLRGLASDEEEKLNNMPEGLQQSSTGEKLTSRVEGCNSAADELEGIDTEFDEEEPAEDDEKAEWQTRRDEFIENALSEAQGVSINYE